MGKTIRVAAAVICDSFPYIRKVYATARGYGEHRGWWEFPGGKIEPGETPQQALTREIREELAVEIAVGERIGTIEYDYPDFHLSMDCFWCEIVSGELTLREAETDGWLGLEELDSMKWLPADRLLLAGIKEAMRMPENIRRIVADEPYRMDGIGMSGSSVLVFADKVLKVQKRSREAENERRMLAWLEGKLPVPRILAYEEKGEISWLLMSRMPGQMACEERYRADPAGQARLLAAGLKRLWSVEIAGCPADWRLERKLAEARHNVECGLVDMGNVEPDTFGEHGFADPAALLQWLCDHRPAEEPVLSHGDYCPPNLFGREEEPCGYIDLGRTGIADKWCDIALCYRSLAHNYGGMHSDRPFREGHDATLLFRELGIEPEWEKIRYYILLDELF